MLVVRLRGTEAEMGARHGEILRARGGHDALLDYYPRMPGRMLRGSAGSAVERAVMHAFEPAFRWLLGRIDRRRPAVLRARTTAFTAAVGRPGTEWTLTVMDGFQNAIGLAARFALAPFTQRAAAAFPAACSTAMAWGRATTDGRLLHARNFDFPGTGVWDAAPEVVLCTPVDGLRYGFVTALGADVPGVTVFNEAGITVTSHTRLHRGVGFDGAAVVDLVHTIARAARTLDDAVAVLRASPSASSWGLCISSAVERRAIVAETGAGRVEVVEARPGEDFVATTNRYHAPALQVDEVAPSAAWIDHCEGRLLRLRSWLADPVDVPDLQAALGDDVDATGQRRPAGAVLAQPCTVQSVVVDPDRRCVWLGVGAVPAARGPWVAIPWAWDGPEAEEVAVPPAPAAEPAYAAFREASRLEQVAAPWADIALRVEEAAALDPEQPDYAFLSGAFRLKGGDPAAAVAAFARGLAVEAAPFPRGQLLLWGSRAAAAAGDPRAAAWRRELLCLPHPRLAGHHRAALRETTRPYPRRRFARLAVHLQFVDAG